MKFDLMHYTANEHLVCLCHSDELWLFQVVVNYLDKLVKFCTCSYFPIEIRETE